MVKKTPPAARHVIITSDTQPEEKPTAFTEEFIQSHAMVDEGTWILVDMSPSNDWFKTELRDNKVSPADVYQRLGQRLLDKYKILFGGVQEIHAVVEIAKYTGRIHTHANIQIKDPYEFHQRLLILRIKNEGFIRIDVDVINDIDGRKKYLEKDKHKTVLFKQIHWQPELVKPKSKACLKYFEKEHQRELDDPEQSEDNNNIE